MSMQLKQLLDAFIRLRYAVPLVKANDRCIRTPDASDLVFFRSYAIRMLCLPPVPADACKVTSGEATTHFEFLVAVVTRICILSIGSF